MKPRVFPQTVEHLTQFRLSDNLEWCVAVLFENDMISESRAAELLGIRTMTWREVAEEWTKRGWLKNVWERRNKMLADDLRKPMKDKP